MASLRSGSADLPNFHKSLVADSLVLKSGELSFLIVLIIFSLSAIELAFLSSAAFMITNVVAIRNTMINLTGFPN